MTHFFQSAVCHHDVKTQIAAQIEIGFQRHQLLITKNGYREIFDHRTGKPVGDGDSGTAKNFISAANRGGVRRF